MPSKFVEYVHAKPPRCLSMVSAKPTERLIPTIKKPPHESIYYGDYGKPGDIEGTASFIVGCSCGCFLVYLLGYNVMPENGHDSVFVGPLGLECPRCGAVAEFFDTRKHGYDGEQGVNTHYVGTGDPSRVACPTCGETPMFVCVNFSYNQGVENFEGEMAKRSQDFFNTLDVVVQCSKCNCSIEVTSFECD